MPGPAAAYGPRDQLTWPPSITSTAISFNLTSYTSLRTRVHMALIHIFTFSAALLYMCNDVIVTPVHVLNLFSVEIVRRDALMPHSIIPAWDYRAWHHACSGLTAVVVQPCLDAYCMYTHYPRRVAHLYDYVPLLFHADRRLSIRDNRYRYTENLLAVSLTSPTSDFLPLHEWSPFLLSHPDQRFAAAFMCRGISFGFRIGYDSKLQLRPPPGNFPP